MPDINFYLKSVKADKRGFRPIIAQINFDYKKYRKTIEKTKKRYWSTSKQRVKPPGREEDDNRYVEINNFLDNYQSTAKTYFNNILLLGQKVSEQDIKDFFAGKVVIKRVIPTFFEAFEEFIESRKPDNAERTIKGYTTIKNFLKDFQKEMGISIEFENIDHTFFDQLKKYAFEDKKTKDNYFAKILSILKTFLNWAEDRKYIKDTTYKKFSYAEKEIEVIYLTLEELLLLNNYTFKASRHSKVRDLYCFSCFTGLRHSDMKQLKHEHIKDNVILKKIQKTQVIEKIPLNDLAIKILDKYKDLNQTALPQLSSQKANEYIKEACKVAKINTAVVTTESIGGKKTESINPKHKLITMHTGRKTFVTNSLMLGMNVKTIMGITGHKKDNTFNKYVKIAEDYKAIEMENTWNQIKEQPKKNRKKKKKSPKEPNQLN